MTASPTLLSALLDTFLAPSQAFTALRERPAWAWAALLLVAVATAAGTYTLFNGMTPEWLVEQQLAAAGSDIPDDQLPVARANMLAVAPYTAHIAVIGAGIGLLVFALLFGLIYFVGERVLARERNSFGRWLAAASFSMLPMVISALGLIVLVLVRGGGDLPIDLGNYASLNNLVLGIPAGEKGYTLASSVNVFTLWGVALVAVAARVWSGLGWGKAILLAALPSILIYGPWLTYTLLQG